MSLTAPMASPFWKPFPHNDTLLHGTTFVSDTYYDYGNHQHGLTAVVPLAGWYNKFSKKLEGKGQGKLQIAVGSAVGGEDEGQTRILLPVGAAASAEKMKVVIQLVTISSQAPRCKI